MADVTIRPCRVEECETVKEVGQRAHPAASYDDPVERIQRFVKENPGQLLIAEKEGVIGGSVIAGWDGWEGVIHRLAVVPEFKRQGIARALVQEAESLLFAKGARRVTLQTNLNRAEALGFWESLQDIGYKRDPRMVRFMKNI